MSKEIYIICNSPEALKEIASGKHIDLHTKDIFTCNNAFTFFRTSGRHLNFWTDTLEIIRQIQFPENLSDGYHTKVKHIYSPYGLKMANTTLLYRDKGLNFSPIQAGASSGLGALAYLAMCSDYDTIYIIGYTLDERKNPMWENIFKEYEATQNYFFKRDNLNIQNFYKFQKK